MALIGALVALGAPAPARADLVLQREPGDRPVGRARPAGVEPAGAVRGLPRVEVVGGRRGGAARARGAARRPRRRLGGARPRPDGAGRHGSRGDLARVRAGAAWLTTRGAGVTVAVVDTGVDARAPGPRGADRRKPGRARRRPGGERDRRRPQRLRRRLARLGFLRHDNLPADGHGHGTHVAGTVLAAADDAGVVGVAPDSALLPLQALSASGSGYTTDTAAAFAYAGDLGVPVVNASLGSSALTMVERAAIAAHPGTLYVVAAGNGGADQVGDDNDARPRTRAPIRSRTSSASAPPAPTTRPRVLQRRGDERGPVRTRRGRPLHRAGRRVRLDERDVDGLAARRGRRRARRGRAPGLHERAAQAGAARVRAACAGARREGADRRAARRRGRGRLRPARRSGPAPTPDPTPVPTPSPLPVPTPDEDAAPAPVGGPKPGRGPGRRAARRDGRPRSRAGASAAARAAAPAACGRRRCASPPRTPATPWSRSSAARPAATS